MTITPSAPPDNILGDIITLINLINAFIYIIISVYKPKIGLMTKIYIDNKNASTTKVSYNSDYLAVYFLL